MIYLGQSITGTYNFLKCMNLFNSKSCTELPLILSYGFSFWTASAVIASNFETKRLSTYKNGAILYHAVPVMQEYETDREMQGKVPS